MSSWNSRFAVGALALFLLLVVGCRQQQSNPGKIAWLFSFEEAKKKAQAENKFIFVDFTGAWCHWCNVLDRTTFQDDRVVKKARQFVCVKVNTQENRSLVRKYRVTGIPKLCFMKADGDAVLCASGYQSAARMLKLMDKVLKTAR